ncbi:MAG: TetR family transcriptional regulator [Fidelibacterota bacterium]|nr:MAG: TetR family transcriptional regulator [Candidatus Neomarinimicrobiota bacterium]
MSIEELPIREKIILAAIDCIEQAGIQAVTVRSIAERAGVNIAAINYYFGSKRELVNEVLKSTTEEFVGLWQEALESKDEPRERLKKFCITCIDGAFRYPGMTKAHIYGPLILNDSQGYFVKRFNDLLGNIAKEMKVQARDEQENDLKMRLIQMISAVFLPSLVPEMFRDFTGFSLSDAGTREVYVDFLIDRYFVPEIQ